MRLVLIVPGFPKLSETFIVSKFLGLLEHGWDVHVVCSASDAAEWSKFPELDRRPTARKRVHVGWTQEPRWLAGLVLPVAFAECLVRNPLGTGRYLWLGATRFGFSILRQLYLDAELLALKPDLVHFEFGTLAVERTYLRELLSSKIVCSFRGFDLNFAGLENPGYYSEVWADIDAVHVLGQDLWKRAIRRGCPPDKAHVIIPPAIDLDFFTTPAKDNQIGHVSPERVLRILSVGRLEWKKGYEFALQAIAYLRKRAIECEYRIVGSGSFLEAVAFARHQLGLEDRVKLLGPQTRTEVRKHLRWAQVFLHAAVSEGFCNGVLEAQAMEVPVICTDADGLPENVVDGETGFVVPRRNPEALAEKLAALDRDPALRARMGKAGRERVLKHFQLKDQIDAFDRFYREIGSGKLRDET